MSALWREHEGGWSLLEPVGFSDEATLQDLVARAPELLPLSGSPRLAVLGREVKLGPGFADILGVEASGRFVVIEVKLGRNADARRAVVTQALAYAAYLDGMKPEELERSVLGRRLRADGPRTVGEVVARQDQEGAYDPASFAEGMAGSLRDGRFRIVLVLDQAPDELVKLVAYLERVSGELIIDLVTVAAYEVDGSRVIVPQLIEPAAAESPTDEAVSDPDSNVLSEGAEAFEASIDDSTEDAELLRRLSQWARQLEAEGLVRLFSYRGKTERMTLLPRLWDRGAGLVTIWNDGGASLSFWRSVFESAAPSSLPRVETQLGMSIGQGNSTKEINEDLLAVLFEAYEEAAQATQPDSG